MSLETAIIITFIFGYLIGKFNTLYKYRRELKYMLDYKRKIDQLNKQHPTKRFILLGHIVDQKEVQNHVRTEDP